MNIRLYYLIYVGGSLNLYGKTYHIHSCDNFTRQHLRSEGLEQKSCGELPQGEIGPEDSVLETEKKQQQVQPVRKESKMRKYMENDRKVLRFYCTADLPKYPLGESGEKEFVIHFYLSDDSIEVRELRSESATSAGKKYLRRQKIPKGIIINNSCDFPSGKKIATEDFYSPRDFIVGSDVVLLNRSFHIYDCDKFTANYFSCVYGLEVNSEAQELKEPPEKAIVIPPHTKESIGEPEDSLQNCLRLLPKPPKKDLKTYLQYSGTVLRYEAKFSTPWPYESKRRFVFNYFLQDDTFSIFEILPQNAGAMSGKYLHRSKVAKPIRKVNGEHDFYTVEDFYIGSILNIHGRDFEITGADKRVLKYVNERKIPLPKHCELSLRQYFQGLCSK